MSESEEEVTERTGLMATCADVHSSQHDSGVCPTTYDTLMVGSRYDSSEQIQQVTVMSLTRIIATLTSE